MSGQVVDTDTGEVATRAYVESITVTDRHRTDLGDVDALAESIARLGLLQPIVVNAEGRLIAGQRRLEAVKRLGWREIDVHVIATLDDAAGLLVAERDENTCRKDMTASEKYALGKALEELERPKAQARQEAQDFGRNSGSTDPELGSTGRTYEHVAPSIDMSPPTWKRLKHIGDRAAEGDEHAAETLDAIDEGEQTITGGYRKVRCETKTQESSEATEPKSKSNGSAVKTKTYKGRSAADGGRRVINNLIGLSPTFEDLDPADLAPTAEEAAQWERDLSAAESAIRRFRKRLKGA